MLAMVRLRLSGQSEGRELRFGRCPGPERQRALNRLEQLRPCGHDAQLTWQRCSERGEGVAQVLDERMPTGDPVGGGRLLEAAHRIEPLLERVAVPCKPVV